jgi:predicted metalloprotease
MRWDDFRQSANVEDRRDEGGGSAPSSGFGVRTGGLGIGTVIVLGLIGWALGIDPSLLISGTEVLTGGGSSYQSPYPSSPSTGSPSQNQAKTGTPSDQMGKFVAAVLGETEDRWTDIFQQAGKIYQAPKLVMFSGATRSACGAAQSAMGPFYCPNDQRVYLDTSFFQQIEMRFRGCEVGSKACQFSQAYVIAHEVGHHVQNLLGILPKAQQVQRSMERTDSNEIQVRVELQADCLAGVWANRSQERWKFLEPGDIDAALQTASAIGDDTLQKRAQGYVVPDAFTHGSAEQRKRWFMAGLKGGTLQACDTFSAAQL